MQEKKNFFELLNPQSALLVGVVGGLLALGTIGFIVLSIVTLNNKGVKLSVNTKETVQQQGDNQPSVPEVPKSDKPVVELFVMSYCPYGLQMEKAMLPAWALLKDKADLSIKFVYYAMHEKQEVDENTRQYCVQKEQQDKLIPYLNCFVVSGDSAGCLSSAAVNTAKLNSCVARTDKEFGITAKYNDRASWLSGRFPLYPVDKVLNEKYGVGGSPTMVINGKDVQVNRTPEAVKQAICAAFNTAPDACKQTLSVEASSAGFGAGSGGNAAAAAGCGN